MQLLIDIGLTFIYLCAFLLVLAWMWRFWMMYINLKFVDKFNKECILLEIKLPREIFKSPLATEVALATLLQGGGYGNWYQRNFQGNLPMWSSLEIASLEGVIHFYIRINKKFKNLVEANFYAQYPGIEIIEADDYTKKIRYHHLQSDVKTWCAQYNLSGKWKPVNPEDGLPFPAPGAKTDKDKYEMPGDFFPIKTYVDYELDKDPKEEFKIDPITPLLEFMGDIGKGEYYWYQIMLLDEGSYKDDKLGKFYVNEITHEHFSLAEIAKAKKDQIRSAGWNIKNKVFADEFGVPKIIDSFDKDYVQQFTIEKDKDGKEIKIPKKVLAKHLETKQIFKKEMDLTPVEKEEIEIINKKLSKPLAAVTIRLIYLTRGSFDPAHVQNTLSFPKPFKGANGLNPTVNDPYSFKWQNRGGKRSNWRAEEMFEEYVEREAFYPHIKPRKILDEWEDMFFYPYSMKTRKMFRMTYEAIFHPFEHPHADRVSIMNLEEVATLWHLPGQVAGTPTLPRIDSVKGNAPSNLPM